MRKVLFIAATHGDEPISVSVMKRIEKSLSKKDYAYDWIVGNPEAYEKNVRYIEKDLNRSAPGDISSGTYETKRAAEIVELAKKYDAVVDLHWTSTDLGVVSIVPYPNEENISLAESFGLKRNVIWYSQSSKKYGPIAQYAGVPAVEIECGSKDNPEMEGSLYKLIFNFLEANKLGKPIKNAQKPEFYNVYGKIPGDSSASFEDFVATTYREETFYPFLSGNDYSDIICYKMNKIQRSKIAMR